MALEAHGVQKDASGDRMQSLMSKIDQETSLKVMPEDDEKFWSAVKAEANRVHFRLVYHAENKAAKKELPRKPPGKQTKKSGPAKGKTEIAHTAANVKIDISHFCGDDGPVELLDASRFGQDQKGLAVMNANEAGKFASNQRAVYEWPRHPCAWKCLCFH